MTMTLDLSKSSGALDLTKAAPSFKTIRGTLNWEPHPVHGASMSQGFDLDIWAFVLDDANKVGGAQDVVFFNKKSYANGTITIPVDNRTGEGKDDEYIDLLLNNIPADKSKVDIYVFIFDAANRKQSFGMMANSNFVLRDVDNNTDIVKYELSTYTNETAIHIGRFERSGSSWTFTPSGDVASADPNAVFSLYQ